MKRDMELVRKIMFKIEEDYSGTPIRTFQIDGYDMITVAEHCRLMNEYDRLCTNPLHEPDKAAEQSVSEVRNYLDEIAAGFELPVLARLPIDPAVAEAYDNGLMETVNTDALADAIKAVENI